MNSISLELKGLVKITHLLLKEKALASKLSELWTLIYIKINGGRPNFMPHLPNVLSMLA